MTAFEKTRPGPTAVELSIGTWRISIRRTIPEIPDIAHMYNNAAWVWHPIVSLLGYARAYERLFRTLAADGRFRHLPDDVKALDCGIGTGALSLALAKTVRGVREIHGVDIAPRMLARARVNLRHSGPAELTTELRYGDVDDLPYSANEFDVVMSAHSLEYSSDPLKTLREMARVLRPGGALLTITTNVNRISALHGLRWRYEPIESHQLQQWMRQAGLTEIRHYPLGGSLFALGSLSEAHIGWRNQQAIGDQ